MSSSNHRTAILITGCFLIPIFAILGGVAGYWLYTFQFEPETGLPNTWQDLGSPPVEIEHLITARTNTIYAQTNDGRIFSCYNEEQYERDCWNVVETIPKEGLGPCPDPAWGIPPEPDEVIDRVVMHHCIASPVYEGDHVFAYVLLADGTVMQWVSEPIGFKFPLRETTYLTQNVCRGCTLGLLGGLVVLILALFRFNAL